MVKASNVASRRCTSRDPSTGEMFKMTCRCVCVCVCAVAGRGCVHVCEKERGEGEEGGREREVGEGQAH